MAAASGHVEAAVEAVFREEWGRIVASLIATTGDWDLAEECAQDAFARALQVWVRDGVPARPGAWLTTVARNRAVDVLRRRANETVKLQQALLLSRAEEQAEEPAEEPAEEQAQEQAEEQAEEPADEQAEEQAGEPAATEAGGGIADDRLRLIFTCCHPALPLEARVALTLRTLAGLTTAEIARAFLVSEPAMALLPAVRADLLRRLDRPAEAAQAYRAAIDQAGTEPERHYLQRRLAELTSP